jgi:hypothetical protein
MNSAYHDVHSLSKLYCEEALQEAQTRHLVERARVGREQRSGRGRLGLACRGVLSLLRSARC